MRVIDENWRQALGLRPAPVFKEGRRASVCLTDMLDADCDAAAIVRPDRSVQGVLTQIALLAYATGDGLAPHVTAGDLAEAFVQVPDEGLDTLSRCLPELLRRRVTNVLCHVNGDLFIATAPQIAALATRLTLDRLRHIEGTGRGAPCGPRPQAAGDSARMALI